MVLSVINSNSSGNSYAIIGEDEILLLEAGINPRQISKAINYQWSKVVGCCATHVHSDHAKYIEEIASRVPVVCNEDVVEKKGIKAITPKEGETVKLGGFSITPFLVKHDVLSYGYLINHPQCGVILFATDTDTLPYQFEGVNHWLIEANYSDKILHDALYEGRLDRRQCERIMVSHMSLENCIRNLRESHAENADTITLIHLSSRHSNPKQFADTVAGAFGVPTQVASKGITVNLNKEII